MSVIITGDVPYIDRVSTKGTLIVAAKESESIVLQRYLEVSNYE